MKGRHKPFNHFSVIKKTATTLTAHKSKYVDITSIYYNKQTNKEPKLRSSKSTCISIKPAIF